MTGLPPRVRMSVQPSFDHRAAAAPGATAITARALGTYLVSRVPAISEQVFKTKQLPVFTLIGEDIVLARSPGG